MKPSSIVVIIIVIVSVICCLTAACGLFIASRFLGSPVDSFDFGAPPQTGDVAPDFELKTIDGDNITLSEFRGQPVMLNFWALWCGPCIDEMPFIQERYKRYNQNLVVLAIENESSIASLGNYVNETQFSFPVLEGTDAVGKKFNIQAYPTSIFIDADGVIQSIVIGSLSASEIDAELAKIGVGY